MQKINVRINGHLKRYTYYAEDDIKVGDNIKVVTARNGSGVDAVVTSVNVKNKKRHIKHYKGGSER